MKVPKNMYERHGEIDIETCVQKREPKNIKPRFW